MVPFRKFDPAKHHRRSIRLQNWDYTSPGIYFITMRVETNSVHFGQKISGKLKLNDFGKIVAASWLDIPNHYENVELGEWIVMPDHFHGIIVIKENITEKRDKVSRTNSVGAIPVKAIHESPQLEEPESPQPNEPESPQLISLQQIKPSNTDFIEYRNKRRKMLLSKIIGRFKMVSAKHINMKLHSSGRIWQRDYFEHIVRDKYSLARIRNYIKTNPERLSDL
jgi:putative transposase